MDEELAGQPFVGSSGQELDRQLREAGINRAECFVTNVCHYRPPSNEMSAWLTDKKTVGKKNGWEEINGRWAHPLVAEGRRELLRLIDQYKPDLVIGFGNTPLWAITGEWGISNWRGSEMIVPHFETINGLRKVVGESHFVPTFHPASILRQWSERPSVIHDLKYRCKRRLNEGFKQPTYNFNISPTFDEVIAWLDEADGDIAGDIETMKGKTVCLGLAKSPYDAICIPFISYNGVYWSHEEQERIMQRIKELSGRVIWIGQNWNYDRQYIQEDFDFDIRPSFDTLVAQSVLFPGTERGLGYLSSMYCEHHLYWKEDGKEWKTGIKDFNKEFRYNCTDVARDWEIAQAQRKMLQQAGLTKQFEERMRYADYVYRMMRRGVIRDEQRTQKMLGEVNEAIHERELAVAHISGHSVNFASPKQVSQLLFSEKGFKPIGKTTAKGAASTNDEALKKLTEKQPDAAVICTPILEARSLATIKSNFLEAEVDPDGKLRASWMATGTETFRLTSSKNAFHRGGPLQNITDGKHTHSGRPLPNLRSTIVPPPGAIYWNCDLERADVQVVAWEANDESLKKALKDRADIHLMNAVMLFDIPNVPYDECLESHPRYKEHKERHEQKRHFGKTFVHLTNYGGGSRTCAIKTHSTVHQADLLQRRWFDLHPGIRDWHRRTHAALLGTRTVRNRFGYRRVYFDRVDGLLPEALAWVPQSTISIVISLIHMEMEDRLNHLGDQFGVTLQVHDSLTGYYHSSIENIALPLMYKASKQVIVPYDDPLWIPLELATSESSWGEMEKRAWTLTN